MSEIFKENQSIIREADKMKKLVEFVVESVIPELKKVVGKNGGKLIAGGLVLGSMYWFGKSFVGSISEGIDDDKEIDKIDSHEQDNNITK
jgi:hypothetical protein